MNRARIRMSSYRDKNAEPIAAGVPNHRARGTASFCAEAKAAFEAGRVGEAITIYEDALFRGHGDCSVYKTLGELYLWLGEYAEALRFLRQSCGPGPPSAELLDRIVLALVSLGQVDEAVDEVAEGLDSLPDMEITPGSLTEAVLLAGGSAETEASGSTFVEPLAAYSKAAILIADVLFGTQRYAEAKRWYEQVLESEPDDLVYARLAHICRFTGRLWQAAEYLRRAIETDPDNAAYLANLGTLLISLGKPQEGIELSRDAVAKNPADPLVHSNFLWCLHYLPDQDRQALFEQHCRWGRLHGPTSLARTSHDNIPDPDRRLRIGYISPDFRIHSVAYNFRALLSGRDQGAVEVYGYGNVRVPDDFTRHFRNEFDYYRDIRELSDEEVVRVIEQDRIDILVAVAGHTSDNRLRVLAYKPAPIQVDYQGINTTGMAQIDYRLTDGQLDPPGSQEFYTEELVYLPGGLVCYTPPDCAVSVGPLPAERNGYVSFGSFNDSLKTNPRTVALWAEVLKAMPDSRFLMKFAGGGERELAEYYLNLFEQNGIHRDRVQVLGWKPFIEHMRLYSEVDIALDTYPYNGCLTTLEGLWMGVPAISLVGENHISRVGLSMLSRIGLEYFATPTPEDYVAKAAALARNQQALAKIRASLRRRMSASSLCDVKAYARSVESAYRQMWRRWCQSVTAEAGAEVLQRPDGQTYNATACCARGSERIEDKLSEKI